ncbi:MAG TPA: hypothetical protein VNK04_17170 [Gemmataceae bacterium]|nr:hypothetical protein [Gemmataceae bacterium]
MSTTNQPDPWQAPAVRGYWLLCLVALLAVTLALVFRKLGAWSLLPLLAGGLSLAGRWRSGPLLTVAVLGWILYSERLGLSPLDLVERVLFTLVYLFFGGRPRYTAVRLSFGIGGRFLISDLVLCAGALAYCAAHYRLVGLAAHLYPPDRRRPPSRPPAWVRPPGIEPRRSERSVEPREVVRLAALVPVWVAVGGLFWWWLKEQRAPVLEWPSPVWRVIYPVLEPTGPPTPLQLPPVLWQVILLIWVLGLGLIAAGAVIGYLGWRRLSPTEAALYLQDTLWRETCREQRLLNRWLVWARRRRRREEKS